MAKEKVKKDVELDAQTESDQVDSLEDRINKLRKDLDDNLADLYQEMINMRDKINKAMERLGLEKL